MTRPIPRGVVPPVPTFLTGTGLDAKHLSSLVARVAESGADGVLVLGTAGEGPALDPSIRNASIECASAVMADRAVVAGCAGHTARETLVRIGEAATAGASAVLVMPPYFYRHPQSSIVAYYTAVADGSDLPVLLYNIPAMTGNSIEVASVRVLAEHPNVVGVKESSGDFPRYVSLADEFASESFVVFQGVAGLVGASLAVGETDTMCTVTGLVPELEMRLRSAVAAGATVEARLESHAIAAVATLFNTGSAPLPVNLKAVANLLGLGPPDAHDPAAAIDDDVLDAMRTKLRELDLPLADEPR